MVTHTKFPAAIEEMLDGFAPVIKQGGHLIIVAPSNASANSPAIAHTIGLEHRFNHPELLLLGMPMVAANKILVGITEMIEKSGAAIPLHQPVAQILRDHPVLLKPVTIEAARPYTLIANAWYEQLKREFRLLQVVWPDPHGKFPWQPQYDKRYAANQPLLFAIQ